MKIVKQELRERVAWLVKIRLGFLGTFLIFLLLWNTVHWPENIGPFVLVFICVAIYETAFLFYISRKRIEHSDAVLLANLQILLDFLALSALTYLTGGIFSPLSFFFIFHVIMAGILLSKRNSLAVSILAVILYSTSGAASFLYPPAHLRPVVEFLSENSFWGVGIAAAFIGTILYTWFTSNEVGGKLEGRMAEVMALRELLEEKVSELNMAYNALLESERAKARYMRRISHQLKAPLGTISLLLMTVLKDDKSRLSDESRKAIEKALGKIDESVILLSDILALAKARTVKREVKPKEVNLAEFAKDVAEPFRRMAEDKGLKFTVAVNLSSEKCTIDDEGLKMVLENLLSNAVKYTEKGRVEFRIWDDEENIHIEVSDTGIGMDEEDLKRLFEEFYRSKRAREMAKGTGLGMSIVRSILDSWGAEMEVSSEIGKGTKFHIRVKKEKFASRRMVS